MSTDPTSRGGELLSPQLQLFVPTDEADDDGQRLSSSLTLCEFYERYIEPVCLVRSAQRNRNQFRESLAYWKRFTGDPPLHAIDEFTCARFLAAISELPGVVPGEPMSDNTVRKHCIVIEQCLNYAAPKQKRDKKYKLARGLIAEAPEIDKPAVQIKDVNDNFTLPEVGRLLEACSDVRGKPIAGLSRPDYWRRAILYMLNVGHRSMTVRALDWRWMFEDEFGWWIRVPSRRSAAKKKQGRDYHLNQWALAAIHTGNRPDNRVFPWPCSREHFHKQFHRIVLAAGLPPVRQFGTHGLRKCFSTELAKINGLIVPMALGHAEGGRRATVAALHYVHREALVEALGKLPQPIWRRPGVALQLELFC